MLYFMSEKSDFVFILIDFARYMLIKGNWNVPFLGKKIITIMDQNVVIVVCGGLTLKELYLSYETNLQVIIIRLKS